jgi:hypothetical protein
VCASLGVVETADLCLRPTKRSLGGQVRIEWLGHSERLVFARHSLSREMDSAQVAGCRGLRHLTKRATDLAFAHGRASYDFVRT